MPFAVANVTDDVPVVVPVLTRLVVNVCDSSWVYCAAEKFTTPPLGVPVGVTVGVAVAVGVAVGVAVAVAVAVGVAVGVGVGVPPGRITRYEPITVAVPKSPTSSAGKKMLPVVGAVNSAVYAAGVTVQVPAPVNANCPAVNVVVAVAE